MNSILKLLLLSSVIFSQACKEDCNACFTPPEPFLFELVDKTTNENLFANGTYQSSQLKLINSINDNHVEFNFVDEDEINLIQVNSIGWQSETVNIQFKISTPTIFTFYIDAERKSENCCSFTSYNEIRLENAEFELDSETGIYKILL